MLRLAFTLVALLAALVQCAPTLSEPPPPPPPRSSGESRISLPEERLSTPELIRYWKYPAETHQVTTADGYILELHRIPYGRGGALHQRDSARHSHVARAA